MDHDHPHCDRCGACTDDLRIVTVCTPGRVEVVWLDYQPYEVDLPAREDTMWWCASSGTLTYDDRGQPSAGADATEVRLQ